MEKYSLSCDQHDYIEIACMFGYHVKLIFKDQQTLEGKAIDTYTSADKHEYLIIDDGRKHQIDFAHLKKLQVLTAHARFSEVSF